MEIRRIRALGPRVRVCMPVVFAAVLSFVLVTAATGQQAYTHGQNIAPVFEGWEQNPDGSFTMVFGFFNRNCEEVLHIPIGADNSIEPGGPDRGQPTRFFPRRGQFNFRVRVPKDFGDKELVWTLTAHGKTETAYASLRPQYVIDKRITMMNEAGFGAQADETASLHPVLRLESDTRRTVTVGEALSLTVFASDDGLPKPRKGRDDTNNAGLIFGWLVYRGDDTHVTFDPEQFNPDFRGRYAGSSLCKNIPPIPEWAMEPLPADGKVTMTATFSEPGTYVLRAMAHDGGLKTTKEVTVTVTATQSASSR